MESKKRALGKGLEQLFNNENFDLNTFEQKIYETTPQEEIIEINLDELRPNPYQPRKKFDEEALKELAESIKEHGLIQPIIAKKSIKGYEIIAGERRVRASRLANLETIPAIIRDLTDEQMMEIALLENLQRENLNVVEEAMAYKSMIEKLELTQEKLSKRVGKSRSHITNILGILNLPNEVQELIYSNKLTMGHARALSKLESTEQIIEIADRIVNNKLPVREIEKLTTTDEIKKRNKISRKPKPNIEYEFVQELIREKLDTKVKIKENKIEISFNNMADLNRILEILDIKE